MFNLVAKNVRNGSGSYRAMVLNSITSNPKLIKYKENFIAIDENPQVVKILDEIKKKKTKITGRKIPTIRDWSLKLQV
jgi:hypothetical protein